MPTCETDKVQQRSSLQHNDILRLLPRVGSHQLLRVGFEHSSWHLCETKCLIQLEKILILCWELPTQASLTKRVLASTDSVTIRRVTRAFERPTTATASGGHARVANAKPTYEASLRTTKSAHCNDQDTSMSHNDPAKAGCSARTESHGEDGNTGCFFGIGALVFEKVLISETRGPIMRNRGPIQRNTVSLNRTAHE